MSHDPFRIDGPTCISFSGGRTSAYMLWRVLQSHGGKLPADAVVCFANTGKAEEAARWRMVTAQAAVEVWRSMEASNRGMDRGTR